MNSSRRPAVRLASLCILVMTPVYYLVPWPQLDGAGASLGMFFIVLYGLFLPGFLLRDRLSTRHYDALEALGRSLALGLAMFLCVLFLWVLTATSLGTCIRFYPMVPAAAALWSLFRRPTRHLEPIEMRRKGSALAAVFGVLLGAVFVLVLRSGLPIDYTKDTLDHVAYVNQISETDRAFPVDAFYVDAGTNGNDIRKGILHHAYGFIGAYLGIDAERTLRGMNALMAVLALLAVYSVAVIWFEDRLVAVLSTVLFLLAVSGGLRGAMIRTSFYPNQIGVAFLLFTIVHCVNYVTTNDRRDLRDASLFAFGAFAAHVFFAVAIVFVGLVLKVWQLMFPRVTARDHTMRVLRLGLAVLGTMTPYGLFRLLFDYSQTSDVHSEVQGVVLITQNLYMADPVRLWNGIGPLGVLTFFTMFYLWDDRRRYPALGYIFAVYLTIPLLLFNPLLFPLLNKVLSYLVYRLPLVCPFFILSAYFLVRFFERLGDHTPALRYRVLAAMVVAVVLTQIKPVFGNNTFTPWRLERERRSSHLRWKRGLDYLRDHVPAGAVVASDQLSSYSITAFTPHYVVCTLGQHAPPNDLDVELRIRDMRDILSPFVPLERTVELLEEHRATHVVLNDRAATGFPLHYWYMNQNLFPQILAKFERDSDVFELIHDEGGFFVFRIAKVPVHQSVVDDATPLRIDHLPSSYERVDKVSGIARLVGLDIDEDVLDRGDRVNVGLAWSGDRSYPFDNYIVSIRFDHADPELPFAGRPFPKLVRRTKEKLTGERYRFRADHAILQGFLSPDTWSQKGLVIDESSVPIPLEMAPGEYWIHIKIQAIAHQPSYWLRDVFFDDDSYQGTEVGRITIR